MKILSSILLMAVFALLGTGCGGTGRYVAQPALTVTGNGEISPTDALVGLFTDQSTPYRIKLCEADPETRVCSDADEGLSASGVGGLFLPILMDFVGIDVNAQEIEAGELTFSSELDAPLNAIPTACGEVEGRLRIVDGRSAVIEFSNFYCNWAVIGNVITNVKLSIETVNVEEQSFTGYYSIQFNGTGNASGSGYYRAEFTSQEETN